MMEHKAAWYDEGQWEMQNPYTNLFFVYLTQTQNIERQKEKAKTEQMKSPNWLEGPNARGVGGILL